MVTLVLSSHPPVPPRVEKPQETHATRLPQITHHFVDSQTRGSPSNMHGGWGSSFIGEDDEMQVDVEVKPEVDATGNYMYHRMGSVSSVLVICDPPFGKSQDFMTNPGCNSRLAKILIVGSMCHHPFQPTNRSPTMSASHPESLPIRSIRVASRQVHPRVTFTAHFRLNKQIIMQATVFSTHRPGR
jgi:hypothetical protein